MWRLAVGLRKAMVLLDCCLMCVKLLLSLYCCCSLFGDGGGGGGAAAAAAAASAAAAAAAAAVSECRLPHKCTPSPAIFYSSFPHVCCGLLYIPPLPDGQVENRQSYDTNPIYAIMHESIYVSGDGVEGPSGWSAERVLAEDAEVCQSICGTCGFSNRIYRIVARHILAAPCREASCRCTYTPLQKAARENVHHTCAYTVCSVSSRRRMRPAM